MSSVEELIRDEAYKNLAKYTEAYKSCRAAYKGWAYQNHWHDVESHDPPCGAKLQFEEWKLDEEVTGCSIM